MGNIMKDNDENFFFITVNFNNSTVTKNYIDNVSSFESIVIVVDNNSSIQDFSDLKDYCVDKNNVILLRQKENFGYFKGLNKGLEYLKKAGMGRGFVIIGNNDLVFPDNFKTILKQKNFSKDTLAIVPDIYTLDGVHQNPHVVSRVSTARRIFYDIFYSNYYLGTFIRSFYLKFKTVNNIEKDEEEKNIYMGIGAIYILTPNFFSHFDYLDDRVFLWGEEALFGNQIAGVNGKILYLPNLEVVHLESMSTSKIPNRIKYDQMKRSYRIYRNYL